ncbi:uncharacterized protein SCHCODRAFT_02644010 [Schizophyllum commune H4-8]|uniref:uncharacterized protein n=1 Tax=Schizophyllum commune (strain H4-8 / FGSC 9210) TaxID=578458 RepID=UPI00215F7B4C|nr:uncharacterized protein SCHCODRAFT_02644010 [Schizophyllum commune H4-8]KAI5885653.1 hypothetical protein SCHCODRAFT_02644010 [Schizophyllum commune H4-8]
MSNSNSAQPPSALPLSQLEGLRHRAEQIIESIQVLGGAIELGNAPAMYPWPDLLARYNLLLSQTLNFSNSLAAAVPQPPGQRPIDPSERERIFEKLALHPKKALDDAQFQTVVAPLIRHNQTYDILRKESATVAGLCEHLETRGSVGVLGGPTGGQAPTRKPTYADVLAECADIRDAHERRVERGRLVVAQILEKTDRYEWKERVAVEEEEPEELGFDPRYAMNTTTTAAEPEADFGEDDSSSSDDEGMGEDGESGMDEGVDGGMNGIEGDATMEDREMAGVSDEHDIPIDPALQAMWQG